MSDLARLTTALADRYDLLRELGAGGMATVYLARDVRHEREVAIKVLHPDLGAALGAERFLTEIRTTAQLQHPHILPLLDSGAADGLLYYVMPFVAGETLRARLTRETQLPLDDAVLIAREVADALQHAHARGIIHRDIKPENILLQDGHALVADFGIALALSNAGGQRVTQTGLSLGTPQYMAPEQAMGEKTIDARADVYALGAVTYEMLAGEPPFTGPSSQAIVAKVMSSEPAPLQSLRRNVPAPVADAVHHALERLPADRFASVREYGQALSHESSALGASGAAGRGVEQASTSPRLRTAALFILVAASSGVLALALRSLLATPVEQSTVIRAPVVAPPGTRLVEDAVGGFALSPTGGHLAFVVADSSGEKLVIRHADDEFGRVIAVPRPRCLAFSPDGEWLAFVSERTIRRVRVKGGVPETVASIAGGVVRGMAWTRRDTLIFSLNGSYAVAAFAEQATVVLRGSSDALLPFELPNGVLIADRGGSGGQVRSLWAQRGSQWTDLGLLGVQALGHQDGYLIYAASDSTIKAIAFDAERATVSGAPFTVVDSVVTRSAIGSRAAWAPGMLLYLRGIDDNQLVIASSGPTAPRAIALPGPFAYPRLSPDGSRLVVVRRGLLTLIDGIDANAPTAARLTATPALNPEWTPDSRSVMFRSANGTIAQMALDGSQRVETIPTAGRAVSEVVRSHDGRFLVLRTTRDAYDILVAPSEDPGALRPLVATAAREVMPRLSPDDRWMAFLSDESGELRVYVTAFPGPGTPVAISDNGATEPVWGKDGRTVYFRQGDRVVAAELSLQSTPRLVARRVVLRGAFTVDPLTAHPNFDVMPDGRFLMVQPIVNGRTPMLVYNWGAEFRARLRAARR